MTRDGAFAAWVRVPLRNCVPVPDGLSDELAALAEPLSISMQALRVAGDVARPARAGDGAGHDRPGHRACWRAAPARPRWWSAAATMRRGSTRCAAWASTRWPTSPTQSLAEATAPYTQGAPFDVVFEATGVPETITEALALLRRNGIVVVTGIHARPLQLDLTTLVRRQQQLRGSFRPPESDWPEALALMGELGDVMAPMVSHVLPLSQALEGFALAHGKQASKVLLRPGAQRWLTGASALLALWNDVDAGARRAVQRLACRRARARAAHGARHPVGPALRPPRRRTACRAT